MFKFNVLLILLSTYLCSGFKIYNVDPKILGGTDAQDGTIKYQVSLQNVGSHFCGGSIIDTKWVITAAHCTLSRPAKSFRVVVGINQLSSEGQTYTPDKVIIHPDYDTERLVNDLSLVRIPEGIELNDKVQPIALPKFNTQAGDTITVSGWGRTYNFINKENLAIEKIGGEFIASSSHPFFAQFFYYRFSNQELNHGPIPDKLQIVNETAITTTECKIKYLLAKPPITSSHLCTSAPFHEGSCQGDSGGPLVQDNALVGLVSWGPESCGHSNRHPDVNTRIYSFIDWIQETMDKNNLN